MLTRHFMAGAALAVASTACLALPAQAKTVEAVASFTVLADMVRQVGASTFT